MFIISKYPHTYHLLIKIIKSKFTIEKPGSKHFHQVKANPSKLWERDTGLITWVEHSLTLVISLIHTKKHNLILKQNQGHSTMSCILQKHQGHRDKESCGTMPHYRRLKRFHNYMWYVTLNGSLFWRKKKKKPERTLLGQLNKTEYGLWMRY